METIESIRALLNELQNTHKQYTERLAELDQERVKVERARELLEAYVKGVSDTITYLERSLHAS